MDTFNYCGICLAIIKAMTDNRNAVVNKVIVPNISRQLKRDVKQKLLCNSNCCIKKPLGIFKFTYCNTNYIHCPIKIKKITGKGKIKFGICKKFESMENTFINRRKLSTHKYRYHYHRDTTKSKLLQLKTSKSIQEVLNDSVNKNKLHKCKKYKII